MQIFKRNTHLGNIYIIQLIKHFLNFQIKNNIQDIYPFLNFHHSFINCVGINLIFENLELKPNSNLYRTLFCF